MPFIFTGIIDNLTFEIEPPVLTPEDELRLKKAESKASDGPRINASILIKKNFYHEWMLSAMLIRVFFISLFLLSASVGYSNYCCSNLPPRYTPLQDSPADMTWIPGENS